MSHGEPTPDDVRDTYRGAIANDDGGTAGDTYIQKFIDRADRMENSVFSGRIRTQGIIEGDTDDFQLYLACHLIQITEGGEVNTDSQTGGSVTYSHLQGNIDNTLTETRYGRVCMTYLRESGTSYGVELTGGLR